MTFLGDLVYRSSSNSGGQYNRRYLNEVVSVLIYLLILARVQKVAPVILHLDCDEENDFIGS
jgi:hypothetical protein